MEVLVIDAQPASAERTAEMVRGLGHDAVLADDAASGLRLLDASWGSLVLVDRDLPGTSAAEFCRRVRERYDARYIYLVVMCARHDADATAEAIEAGADDCVGKPPRPHELRLRSGTARRVVTLEHELEARNRSLVRAHERLSAELAHATTDLVAASRLQRSRLPRPGRHGNVRAWGFLHAAAYNAGDAFDFFELAPGLFCFYAIDVVGHGTSAAMTSYAVRHLMHGDDDGLVRRNLERCASIDETLARTMSDLNRTFHVDDDHQWFTMLLGIVEQDGGRVTLCQAGHPPAARVARATGRVELIGAGGLPVAMFEDAAFVPVHGRLAPGDRLAVYSDGLLDALTGRGEAAATRRLTIGLSRAAALPFDALTELVGERVLGPERRAAASDDISLVLLEFRPGTERRLEIRPELAELEAVERAVEAMLGEAGVARARADAIALAVSEALCNTIAHGGCAAPIGVRLGCSADRFDAEIADRGAAMPAAVRRRLAERDVAMPARAPGDVEALPERGFGLAILLSTATDVDYRAAPAGNRLALSFAL